MNDDRVFKFSAHLIREMIEARQAQLVKDIQRWEKDGDNPASHRAELEQLCWLLEAEILDGCFTAYQARELIGRARRP